MLRPSIFGENLFDEWMDEFEKDFSRDFFPTKNPLYGKHAKNMMKTDVRETDSGYEVDIDLPGYEKENIKIEVEDGYLTVHASINSNKEEKEEGKFVRKERYVGSCSRSFYVGEEVNDEDIKATFKNGTLKLEIPKKEEKKELPEKKYIQIED